MKNDINLLYKRKQKQYSSKKWAGIMLGVVFFAGALYFGITLPTNNLAATKVQVADLDSKLNENAGIEAQMLEKSVEFRSLEEQLAGLKLISTAKSDVTLYLETIEESVPVEAYITQMSMGDEALDILGVAQSDEILATFMLRLREKNLFSDLYVASTTVMFGTDTTTMFRLTGTLPVSLSDIPMAENEETPQDEANEEAAQ